MDEEKLKYRIALSLIPGIGDIMARTLLSYFGSEEDIFKQKKGKFLKIQGIGSITAEAISSFNDFARAEKEVSFIKKHGIKALFFTDKEYPLRLKQIHDAPLLLYYLGNADLNHPRIVGIVGTRNATDYGKDFCERVVDDLKAYDCLIISGLALGIDLYAHKAALKNDMPTVGVLGHGLDRIYPYQNRGVAQKMLLNGGLLTENISETLPDRENFPRRNRIVAGMLDALVMVESAVKGGGLITAEIANSYNRDVFALPGRHYDNYSKGCNALIKTNKAALIEDAADLIYMMGWDVKPGENVIQNKLAFDLTEDEQKVVNFLSDGKKPVDEICIFLNSGPGTVSLLLLALEFKGIIKSLPGKFYQLIK